MSCPVLSCPVPSPPLQGLFTDTDEQLTHGELYARMDPSVTSDYGMPYIYDDFSWSHCLDEGLDFSTMEMGVEVLGFQS